MPINLQTSCTTTFIARITSSSLNSFRASPGWLGSDSPRPGIQFGDPTKLSPVGFPLQSISFTPTPFSNTIFNN